MTYSGRTGSPYRKIRPVCPLSLTLPGAATVDVERLRAGQVHGVRASEVVIVDYVACVSAGQRGLVALRLRPAAGMLGPARDVLPDDVDAIVADLRGQALCVRGRRDSHGNRRTWVVLNNRDGRTRHRLCRAARGNRDGDSNREAAYCITGRSSHFDSPLLSLPQVRRTTDCIRARCVR
jgi:hypothetical protein